MSSFQSWAVFSPCRTWRYELGRRWDYALPLAMFIGLNPSTADEVENDPTIRRCIAFAKSWGAGGLLMANIFAYRSTDPSVLKGSRDRTAVSKPVAIGPDNDNSLLSMSTQAVWTVAAWGIHGAIHHRGVRVAQMIPDLLCLGTTKQGFPKHPLYLRADTPLEHYA